MIIKIYGKEGCAACTAAANVAHGLAGAEVHSLKIGKDYSIEELMQIAPHGTSFPQVVVGTKLIGTFNDFEWWVKHECL